MSYKKHPSKKLNELYAKNAHQGAEPLDAKVIFVGRDPNWSETIDSTEYFKHVDAYLSDGVSFWQKEGVHHPFLLNDYKGDGKRYHTIFSKIGIDKIHAAEISFVELIGAPTVGMAKKNNKLFKEILLSAENTAHLKELEKILLSKGKLIFIAWGLLDDFKLINKELGGFDSISKIDKAQLDITKLNQVGNLFIHKHFSDSISNDTIASIEVKVQEFLN
jgi:hypothetical protein